MEAEDWNVRDEVLRWIACTWLSGHYVGRHSPSSLDRPRNSADTLNRDLRGLQLL